MHFIESGAVQTVQLLHCDCIYMQQGVFWIDTAVHAHAPREREIEMLLRQSEEISEQSSLRLQRLALPILSSCPREHHVLTLTPRQDMRLELLFQRNYVEGRSKHFELRGRFLHHYINFSFLFLKEQIKGIIIIGAS
jgi:hypothetical protein